MRGAGEDRGSWEHRNLGPSGGRCTGSGRRRPGSGDYARLPGMARAWNQQSAASRSASARPGSSSRSELLARRPRLRRLRPWRWRRWLEQWPLRPSPPGLDRTDLARGPGQPITRAPEARPLLFPAPPQLRRKGSEVNRLKARTLGQPRCPRAEGALLRAPPRLRPPKTLLLKTRAGLPALLYSENSLCNSPMHTWVKAGGSG